MTSNDDVACPLSSWWDDPLFWAWEQSEILLVAVRTIARDERVGCTNIRIRK